MKRNVALVAMVLACLFIGTSAFAAVIGNPRPLPFAINPNSASFESQLFAYVNNSGGSGVLDGIADPTQLSANYFVPNNIFNPQTTAEFTLQFRFAGNSNMISLYSLNDISNKITIFPGAVVPVANTTVTFKKNGSGTWDLKSYDLFDPSTVFGTATFTSPQFGFLLNSSGQNWYGDDSLNQSSEAHMLAFTGIGSSKNGYWFAFEDLPYYNSNGGIVSDRDFNDVVFYAESIHPVPEPGTMMLLGSGLVGLAGWGRKKFRK